MKEPMLISSPALPASHSQPELMACEPSPCAKPTPAAKPSSPKRGRESRSGRTLEPSAWATTTEHRDQSQDTGAPLSAAWPTVKSSDAKQGSNRFGNRPAHKRAKAGANNNELLKMCGFLPLAFPVSQPAGPGSKEARAMTVGSGEKLARSLLPSDPLGDFSRILLESETWASPEFYLTWKHKATRQGCLVWELAPSAPRTGECDTGLFASGWPTAQASDRMNCEGRALRKKNDRENRNPNVSGSYRMELKDAVGQIQPQNKTSGPWPTPAARDIKGPTQNPERSDYIPNILKQNSAAWPTPDRSALEGGIQNPIHAREQGHAIRLKDYCGKTTSGCLARTEKFVVRLTTLSAWLMGYTAQYLALWATASSGRSPRKSSKP